MEEPKSSSDSAYLWVYGLCLLAGLVAFGFGVYVAARGDHGYTLMSAGLVSIVLVLVTWPMAAANASTCKDHADDRDAILRALIDRTQQMAGLLSTISEQQLLSDRAKAVAYREKDRQALRSAIREEMNAKDWDAALVLANDMESEFGYVQEAAVLRAEINNNRHEVITRQVSDAARAIDEHVRAERWSLAVREAERIGQIYPNEQAVQRLPQDIEVRRQGHKKALLDGWKEAVARNDVDGSIEILKRVDPYLTPAEAAAMQETARGVFKERLTNLKEKFSAAVHGNHNADAIRIGELIMQEHPNSRLALEVRDLMDTLRSRGGRVAEAS